MRGVRRMQELKTVIRKVVIELRIFTPKKENIEDESDIRFPVCLLECLAHGYVLFLKKLS